MKFFKCIITKERFPNFEPGSPDGQFHVRTTHSLGQEVRQSLTVLGRKWNMIFVYVPLLACFLLVLAGADLKGG